MSTPSEKLCSKCQRPNSLDANYCSWCGASEFEIDPHQSFRLTLPQAELHRLRLDVRRIIVLGVVSFGLYLLYWAFITWIHLKRETGGNFFPPWHALSLLVPIYGLFRLHHHVRVIKELCDSSGVATNLSPPLIVVMFLLNNILGIVVAFASSQGLAIVLSVISLTLVITILIWAQSTLNAYWAETRGAELREARFSPIEWIVCLLGILSWSGVLVPIG